jgi:esterase
VRRRALVREGLTLWAKQWDPKQGDPKDGSPAETPAVVLVHGRGARADTWQQVAEWVTAHPSGPWQVLAPDLRGHGDSDWDSYRRYDIGSMADDLVAWIDATTTKPCLLVGHSLGAAIALVAAGRHPELVSRLVLEDGGPSSERLVRRWQHTPAAPRSRFADFEDAMAELERLYPGDTTPANRVRRLAHFFESGGSGDVVWRCDMPGMLAAPRDSLLLDRSWDAVADLRCPLTLIVAEENSMLDANIGDRIRAGKPDTEVITVAGARHDVHNSRPDDYLRILESVLIREDGAA